MDRYARLAVRCQKSCGKCGTEGAAEAPLIVSSKKEEEPEATKEEATEKEEEPEATKEEATEKEEEPEATKAEAAQKEMKEEAAGATCTDSKWYSYPYSKSTYETKDGKTVYKETKFASRCEYYKNSKPCDHSSFKSRCGKSCGTGANAPGMDDPYVLRQREVEKSEKYDTRCHYEKALDRCKSPYTSKRCKKTCGLCKEGEDKCDDEAYMKTPYTRSVYKKKKYASQCEYHKLSGRCKYDEQRAQYEKSRAAKDPKYTSRFKPPCQKTCTGEGADDERYAKPYEGYAYTEKKFESRCAFEMERNSNPCKYRIGSYCAKTCTGKGTDRYTQAYTHREPAVKAVKKYANRCEYVKEAKMCQTSEGAGCSKTCDMCGICRDYSSFCKSMKERGHCDMDRYARLAVRCQKSCGKCGTEGAAKAPVVVKHRV